MSEPLTKRLRDFLWYIGDQNRGRIDIGFIDGSTSPIAPLVRLGLLRRDGHDVVITDEGREELSR